MPKINSEEKGKMAMKQPETVEKSSLTGWNRMSEERKRIGKERDANKNSFTPYNRLLRLKKRLGMKKIDEQEECLILDFNPEEGELSSTADSADAVDDDDDEVSTNHEKGEVACGDFPHSRHLCSTFPFESTKPEKCCKQCYCFVCEVAAPCPHWTCGYAQHCDAIDDERWRYVRMYHQNLFEQLAAEQKRLAASEKKKPSGGN